MPVQTPVTSARDGAPALSAIRPDATKKQKLAIGAASVQSTAIAGTCVRLIADVDCHIAIGANPVADATSLLLPAKSPEYFAITSGELIAVIQDAAGGNLYIAVATEL